MSRAEALLRRLDERGVTIRVTDRRVGLSPRWLLTDELRDEIRAHRDDVIALVEAEERDARDVTFEWVTPTSCIVTIRLDETASAEPPDRFTAAVLDTFDGEIVPEDEYSETAPFHEPVVDHGRCYKCGQSSWWQLRSGGPSVCQRCCPCPYPDDRVERWEVSE